MIPLWLMIAQGAKKIADNQNEQANTLNSQSNNSANNAFSTFSTNSFSKASPNASFMSMKVHSLFE